MVQRGCVWGLTGHIDRLLMKTARFVWSVIGFSMVHAVRKWSEQVRELISAVKEGETGRKKSKLMQTTFADHTPDHSEKFNKWCPDRSQTGKLTALRRVPGTLLGWFLARHLVLTLAMLA